MIGKTINDLLDEWRETGKVGKKKPKTLAQAKQEAAMLAESRSQVNIGLMSMLHRGP